MRTTKKQLNYIIWQNRSTRFYLAARNLYFQEISGPCCFCCFQSLELLLKATLIYHVKIFSPSSYNHSIRKLLNTLRNQVKEGKKISIHDYFFYDKRFQSVSRYPTENKGIWIPKDLINDLDETFYELIKIVPFQYNSQLRNIIKEQGNHYKILRYKNKQIRKIRKLLIS